ncbi:hypothetical protein Q3G72_009761 [Acer saccharum]|nr:hypothetical protein Q3G72_009761 [Acer saccharum]
MPTDRDLNGPQTSCEPLFDAAQAALQLAKAHGAQQADVMVNRATDFEVKVCDGHITTLSQAKTKGLGLRVFVDGRLGFCTTSDLTPDNLAQAVLRATQMAKQAAFDPHHGLAAIQPNPPHKQGPLDVFDPAVAALSVEDKITWAHALESAARQSDARVRKFRDSGVSTSIGEQVLVTSEGASHYLKGTDISLWCTPVAEADGQLQTEFWYDSQTHLADLEPVDSIGRTAGLRAARMLGARPVKSQRAAVIFEPLMAAGLLSGMLGALDGDMVYKKSSFLGDKLNTRIAAPGLTLVDDPLVARGVASTPFDGEGLATTRKNLVEHGVLKTFMYDSYTARKAGVSPTANARRSFSSMPHAGAFNFYAEPGPDEPDEILRSAPRALIITRGLGQGLNTVTGEYSRGANGLWVEQGEIVHPVQEVTIAGDYLTMLANIDRIGRDVRRRGSTGAPTLRIQDMMVSGR